jgi:hypothetical protein
VQDRSNSILGASLSNESGGGGDGHSRGYKARWTNDASELDGVVAVAVDVASENGVSTALVSPTGVKYCFDSSTDSLGLVNLAIACIRTARFSLPKVGEVLAYLTSFRFSLLLNMGGS